MSLIDKIHKIHFILIFDGLKRARYLKNKKILRGMGNDIMYQSRKYPMDPKLILLHNNIVIAAGVRFCTHDAIRHVLINKEKKYYEEYTGAIEVEDNVFIGADTIILPNVHIGKNVIIGAGSVVTMDIPEGLIVAGNPAKPIGKFSELMERREKIEKKDIEQIWKEFNIEKHSKGNYNGKNT